MALPARVEGPAGRGGDEEASWHPFNLQRYQPSITASWEGMMRESPPRAVVLIHACWQLWLCRCEQSGTSGLCRLSDCLEPTQNHHLKKEEAPWLDGSEGRRIVQSFRQRRVECETRRSGYTRKSNCTLSGEAKCDPACLHDKHECQSLALRSTSTSILECLQASHPLRST